MKKDEILKLKDEIAEESLAKKDQVDYSKEEDAIYDMSNTQGWRIMVKRANKMIAELLEPIDASQLSESANLALVGANTLANAKALKVFREFFGEVNAIHDQKKKEQERKAKNKETSKSEA